MKHETVLLTPPWDSEPLPIDRGISALIYALWKRGIETDDSCEETEPGLMWISFPDSENANSFLQLAGEGWSWIDYGDFIGVKFPVSDYRRILQKTG